MWITAKSQDKFTAKSQDKFSPEFATENRSLAAMLVGNLRTDLDCGSPVSILLKKICRK
jgi:hypothetical protein